MNDLGEGWQQCHPRQANQDFDNYRDNYLFEQLNRLLY